MVSCEIARTHQHYPSSMPTKKKKQKKRGHTYVSILVVSYWEPLEESLLRSFTLFHCEFERAKMHNQVRAREKNDSSIEFSIKLWKQQWSSSIIEVFSQAAITTNPSKQECPHQEITFVDFGMTVESLSFFFNCIVVMVLTSSQQDYETLLSTPSACFF